MLLKIENKKKTRKNITYIHICLKNNIYILFLFLFFYSIFYLHDIFCIICYITMFVPG